MVYESLQSRLVQPSRSSPPLSSRVGFGYMYTCNKMCGEMLPALLRPITRVCPSPRHSPLIYKEQTSAESQIKKTNPTPSKNRPRLVFCSLRQKKKILKSANHQHRYLYTVSRDDGTHTGSLLERQRRIQGYTQSIQRGEKIA